MAASSGQPAVPGPASTTSGLEMLKNMNVQTGKHATWVVRVLSPKLIRYQFTARGKQVHASKFQCLLVSKDPRQFMLGSVPFSFASPDAASKAFDRFKDGLTFIINTPEFDNKMKSEYMSTPLKRAVLLTAPTKIQPVPLTDADRRNHPADHVDVGLSLQDVMSGPLSWGTNRWGISKIFGAPMSPQQRELNNVEAGINMRTKPRQCIPT